MKDISATLKSVYNAQAVAIVPGGGTFAMESVARQFATGKKCLVVRNGFFSYRWSQIFEFGSIPSQEIVLKAKQTSADSTAPFAPVSIDELVTTIKAEKPDLVFAPHVETSAGIILPDDYMSTLAQAVHEVGGLFVLDCIASGTVWVDMKAVGVDILISAPQKGWSGSPGAGLVMLSDLALAQLDNTQSTSFSADLKKWLQIMQAYENGGHAYHSTMPTDQLTAMRDVMQETVEYGLEVVRQEQLDLGRRVRELLATHGFKSVAAPGFEAPGVVVCYTDDPDVQTAKKFLSLGLQTAAGVPLQCDEPADFRTFRIGLFGLDKLHNIDRTVENLANALATVQPQKAAAA